jgi:hypothetical protein
VKIPSGEKISEGKKLLQVKIPPGKKFPSGENPSR